MVDLDRQNIESGSLFRRLFARFSGIALGRLIGLALLVAFIVVRVWDPVPLQVLRLKTFDLFQIFAPLEKSDQYQVMIVDIDEESLKEHGQWPWPRTKVAAMIKGIASNGGIATAFDVLFAETDRMSPVNFSNATPGLDEALKAKLAQLPSNDAVMAEAMRQTRVVLGESAYYRDVGRTDIDIVKPLPMAAVGRDPKPFLAKYPSLVSNVPALEAAAAGRGLITILPEIDGIIRRVPVLLQADNQVWPALSIELLRIATGGEAVLVRSGGQGLESVVVAGNPIPTDAIGRVWVRFSPHDRNRYVSARHVLSGHESARQLAGKLVFIGTSATGLHDVKTTPVAAFIPGVEIHAQLLEGILKGQLLKRPQLAIGAEIVLATVTGLLIIAVVPVLGALTTLILGAVLAGALSAFAYYLYVRHGVVFDVVYPLISAFAIFGALVFFNYLREEMQKRQIRGAFGQYLSPALVEQLAGDPDKLVLGGETKTLTIMFSDVRGFTSISESYKSDPQGLTSLINRLLTPLSNIIMQRQGTIDKYMGDNVMAFWNAPLDVSGHAAEACSSALEMLKSLDDLNDQRRQEDEDAGRPHLPLNIGVGINTGDCVVGNIGSDMRFDYSVLGDSVNLASRLEGQTKAYGLDLIIGAETAKMVTDTFAVLPVDAIRVKGKEEPEEIFTIIGEADTLADADFASLKTTHQAMLSAYRKQDWAAAGHALEEARTHAEKFDLTGFYDVYAERVAEYEMNPPPVDWDGVYTATSK